MADSLFASVVDIAERWRPLSSSEEVRADALITDASDMIRVRWPDVDDRLESGDLRIATLVRIVAGMVKRAMTVGDLTGVSQQSQSAGPFSVNATYANPDANLYLTKDDITLLDGRGFTSTARVGWLA